MLRVVALHHPPLPLPVENVWERVSTRLGLPFAGELALGRELVRILGPHSDLLLHGHRHVPRKLELSGRDSPLGIYNAGSSTELGRARVFTHRDGRLLHRPVWLGAGDLHAPVRIGRWPGGAPEQTAASAG